MMRIPGLVDDRIAVRSRIANRGSQVTMRLFGLVLAAALAAGCGASRSYGRANNAARAGDWDTAGGEFRGRGPEEPHPPQFQNPPPRGSDNPLPPHPA